MDSGAAVSVIPQDHLEFILIASFTATRAGDHSRGASRKINYPRQINFETMLSPGPGSVYYRWAADMRWHFVPMEVISVISQQTNGWSRAARLVSVLCMLLLEQLRSDKRPPETSRPRQKIADEVEFAKYGT